MNEWYEIQEKEVRPHQQSRKDSKISNVNKKTTVVCQLTGQFRKDTLIPPETHVANVTTMGSFKSAATGSSSYLAGLNIEDNHLVTLALVEPGPEEVEITRRVAGFLTNPTLCISFRTLIFETRAIMNRRTLVTASLGSAQLSTVLVIVNLLVNGVSGSKRSIRYARVTLAV